MVAEIYASFTNNPGTLTLTATDHGTIEPEGTREIDLDLPVAVSAQAEPFHHFSHWQVTAGSALIADASAPETEITVTNAATTVEAVFVLNDVNRNLLYSALSSG